MHKKMSLELSGTNTCGCNNTIYIKKSNLAIMSFGSQNNVFGVSLRKGGMGCV
jgi:hypothetical protein